MVCSYSQLMVKSLQMTARDAYLRRTYGITEEDYERLLQRQKRRCAVCRRDASGFISRLNVDHDHNTGEVRGLLCTNCNRFVVGRHRRGTGGEVLLRNASQYLEGPYTGWFVPPKKKRRKTKKGRSGKNPSNNPG